MNALLEEIRSRGYWKVIIRPATFKEKRVQDKSALEHILRKTSVSIKGWSFPQVDTLGKPETGPDWIGQGIATGPIRELWRFYQSGQFVHYFGMVEDRVNSHQWMPPENGRQPVVLSAESVVAQFTEIFEFAARLSFTEVGDTGTHLEVAAVNISNHCLPAQLNSGLGRLLQSRVTEVTFKTDPSRTELVAEKRDLALKAAIQFFRCFEWEPSIELLRDIQAGILNREQISGPFLVR